MPRNRTHRLLRAQDGGAIITCMVDPYKLWEVTYSPRHDRDSKPWYVGGQHFSGSECKAWVPALLTEALTEAQTAPGPSQEES